MTKWFFSFVVVILLSQFRVQSYAGAELKIQNNGQFPYMAAVEFKERHKCGGVVVTTNFILTAASCIDGLDKKDLRVTGGTFRRNDVNDPNRQIRKVKLIVNLKEYERQGPKNDVTGLILKKPFTFNKYLESIQLPCVNFGKGYKAYYEKLIGAKVTVLGWGLPNWEKSKYLQEAALKIIKPERCQKMTNLPVKHLSILCAIDEPDHKIGHTKGDWGGPLILKSSTTDPKNDLLLGIATFSTKEDNNAPNTRKPFLYADITGSILQILAIIRKYEVGGWNEDICFKMFLKKLI